MVLFQGKVVFPRRAKSCCVSGRLLAEAGQPIPNPVCKTESSWWVSKAVALIEAGKPKPSRFKIRLASQNLAGSFQSYRAGGSEIGAENLFFLPGFPAKPGIGGSNQVSAFPKKLLFRNVISYCSEIIEIIPECKNRRSGLTIRAQVVNVKSAL